MPYACRDRSLGRCSGRAYPRGTTSTPLCRRHWQKRQSVSPESAFRSMLTDRQLQQLETKVARHGDSIARITVGKWQLWMTWSGKKLYAVGINGPHGTPRCLQAIYRDPRQGTVMLNHHEPYVAAIALLSMLQANPAWVQRTAG